jgi:tripartite-type tricarboxylate transporter receptor subunit TctC
LLPDGWSAAASQAISEAIHTIAITPPGGAVDVSADLSPPASDGDSGWSVRIHNRAEGIDFPLYTAGGAHAATYCTAPDAAAAAVTALRCEIAR